MFPYSGHYLCSKRQECEWGEKRLLNYRLSSKLTQRKEGYPRLHTYLRLVPEYQMIVAEKDLVRNS